jgi:hypothetical protein
MASYGGWKEALNWIREIGTILVTPFRSCVKTTGNAWRVSDRGATYPFPSLAILRYMEEILCYPSLLGICLVVLCRTRIGAHVVR